MNSGVAPDQHVYIGVVSSGHAFKAQTTLFQYIEFYRKFVFQTKIMSAYLFFSKLLLKNNMAFLKTAYSKCMSVYLFFSKLLLSVYLFFSKLLLKNNMAFFKNCL